MSARPTISRLRDLRDIVGTPLDGQVAAWDNTNAHFVWLTPTGGGGGGTAGGDLAGTYPNPTIKNSLRDPVAGTAGLRTLGTGATQAAAGNDSRLSDARTPLAHTHPESDVTGLTADLAARELTANKGAVSGYASLDTNTRVPDAQLGTGAASATKYLRGDRSWQVPQYSELGGVPSTFAPSAHKTSHEPGGSDALSALTSASFAAGSIDGTAGTASLRTLGTGAQQAAAGNDARLSDSRTPLAHQSTHVANGSDTLPWTTIHGKGTAAARPTAGATNSGYTYFATDTDGGTLARSDGSVWTKLALALSEPAGGDLTGTLPSPSIAAGAVTSAKLATAVSDLLPTTGQKNALAGTNGTPGSGNPYVTSTDPAMTNARTPTAHAATHLGGSDDMLGGASGLDLRYLRLSTAPGSGAVPYSNAAGAISWSSTLTWDETNRLLDATSSASGTTPELRAENTATSGTGLLRARGKTAGGVVTEGYMQSTAAAVNIGSASAHPAIFVANATEKFRLNSGGGIQIADAVNLALGTTTGTMIGTTSSQKLGVLGATPIVQQAQTVDLKSLLVNFGFYSSVAGATPLNLGGGLVTAAVGTGATFVIAASNASARVKAQADYVCTGTADDVQIAAAIAALPAGGGLILLSEGTFTNAASVNTPTNVRIQGAGVGATIVKQANGANLNTIFTNPDWTNGNGAMHVCYLTLDGNKANQTGGQGFGIQWVKPFGGAGCSWVEAKNCRGDGIQFNGNGDPTISRLVFGDNLYCHDNASNGFKATFGMRNGVYTNIFTYNNGVDGIVCDASEDIFVNAYARNNTRHGIFIRNVFSSSHSNLVATGNGRIGILAVDMNSSQGVNWRAQNNSQSSSGTYDDIVFPGNLGTITSIVVDTGGSGYSTPPTVTITDPHGLPLGSGAAATATVAGGVVTGVTVTLAGDLYSATVVPTIAFGGPGTGATAHAVVTPYSYGISKNSLVTGIVAGYEAQIGAGPTERYGIYVDDDLTGDFQLHGITYGSTVQTDPARIPTTFGSFALDDTKSGVDRTLGESRWHGEILGNTLSNTNYSRIGLRYNSGSTRYEILQESGGTGTARTLRIGTLGASTLELVTNGVVRQAWDSTGKVTTGLSHDGFKGTPGFYSAGAAAVTTAISNTSYFQYIGRVASPITTCDVVCRVTTLAATITWAEIGIFKGTSVANGAATLTRVGSADVSATFNSTGIKKTTVTLSGVTAGDELWVAYGSQATTPFQLRGGVVDDIQSGVLQEKATTRISTVASATAMGVSAATLVPAWIVVKL